MKMRIYRFFAFSKSNRFDLLFCIFTFSALLFRISLHGDFFDEIFNLSVSYRIALGQIPFYECWEIFQTGDMLLSPIIWVYINVFGGTGGIILFSRILYIFILILLSTQMYNVLSKTIKSRISFRISYLCLFFQLYGLFYLWYDSLAVVFLISGCLCICQYLQKEKKAILFIAGILHGLMAFSIPSFILLIPMIIIVMIFYCKIYICNLKKSIEILLYYSLGGIFLVLLFAIYIFSIVGVSNFIFGISKMLSMRTISQSSESLPLLLNIIITFINVNQNLLIPTICLLLMYLLSFRFGRFKVLLCIALIIVPFFFTLNVDEIFKGLPNYTAYLALWAPLLYFLVYKENFNTEYKSLLFFLWGPSILSSLPIAYTTMQGSYGPIKCWQGFFGGFIVSVLLLMCILENNCKSIKYFSYIPFIFSLQLLYLSYNYVYQNLSYPELTSARIKSGIYMGLKVNNDMQNIEQIEFDINLLAKDKETVLAGSSTRFVYLMTDLKPFTPLVAEFYWPAIKDYIVEFERLPDLIFLSEDEKEQDGMKQLLDSSYKLLYNNIWYGSNFYAFEKRDIIK